MLTPAPAPTKPIRKPKPRPRPKPKAAREPAPASRQRASGMNAMDVHGGLRIRLEYDPNQRTIVAKWSGETTVLAVCADVDRRAAQLRHQLGLLDTWLERYRSQQAGGARCPVCAELTTGPEGLCQEHLSDTR